ncbi:PAS domain S-box-containing protein/diguanylate cyclase (GGDEF) domain-containing protein [Paracidovorax valerianellae]|uniref:PAS domain S-box-containing protein/diguanylate cyclase (GGDEF) domain-containing protein n=2 Tax=Paracidovorax valerianellae TaxID=187868 RepID=A0A1G6NUR0_9BURK|nr:EAL domain-containing protein [Paracidovorax valerianellae]MDA8444652.1 EAL domain-containing protein [Paracidovorax valerianellae]SDC71740.1 PAS domain S-box-containing protein/diguanylate cyclase (GGDEF) domain-containing protein [Paracidovorax valerianellae]
MSAVPAVPAAPLAGMVAGHPADGNTVAPATGNVALPLDAPMPAMPVAPVALLPLRTGMARARIGWIDSLAASAPADREWLVRHWPDWDVRDLPGLADRPGSPLQPPAAFDGDALVLCLPRDAISLPGWVTKARDRPLMLCLEPAQETLAARALRHGPGDYVLRADGNAHLPELAQRLAVLLEQRPTVPAGVTDAATAIAFALPWAEELRAQRALLQTTLASMSQGLYTVGADGRITVYNDRLLELLDLPRALFEARPTPMQVKRVQMERGDFGEGAGLVDRQGQAYVRSGGELPPPDVYWRRTRSGRTLEVHTAPLPDGGMVRTFTDVTEHVRTQAELRVSEARFRSLSDLSSDWYWEQDTAYRFIHFVSGRSTQAMAPGEVVGRTRWEIGALNMADEDWVAHRRLLDAREPFRDLELRRLSADGTAYWVSISGVPVFDDAGTFQGYRGVGRSISDRKQVEAEIERLAFFDALTGLPNRRMLIDRLYRATVAVGRTRRHGVLLFIDLDNFKDLNDTRGHDMGDRLLVQVAQRLQACVRQSDTVARFGGDEFVVLAEGLPAESWAASADASQLARKIGTALSLPYLLDGISHHSTPSIGLTLFGEAAGSVDDLLKHADMAMYQAKAAGRNAVRFFDPEMQAAVSARAVLEAELRRGLQAGELVLHYQPIVDRRGQMLGAEALVRWLHPQRGIVSPGEFIPVAEQSGLIVQLGQWVLERGCQQLVAWSRSAATAQLVLSINVSVRQFRQPDFVHQVLHALRESGAQPRLFKIELTESLLLTDVEDVITRMELLRAQGVGFSLDDFGTGYSSLSYLKRLPIDQLKIDQGFVRDVLTDPNDAAIVRTILALAQSLDLHVVAEGVETTGQLQFLQRHGCHAFQGYLFGRPAPATVLERAVRPAL